MNILTLGGATQDICVSYSNQETAYLDTPEGKRRFLLLPEGAKIELENVAYFPGGGAANAAVSFARQGFSSNIVSCVGNDCQGDMIQKNLVDQGVNTQYLHRFTDGQTAFSIIIRLASGDRTVLVHRGTSCNFAFNHILLENLTLYNQLYITSLSSANAALLSTITQHARSHNIPVAVNPGSSQLRAGAHHLRAALGSIEVLILNSYEASLLMQSFSPQSPKVINPIHHGPSLLVPNDILDVRLFCSTILHSGPRIVVVTNGAEGVYVATDSTLYFHKSPAIPVVSTLGAGDAFGSAFVGQLLSSGSLTHAIRAGIANSLSVISAYGAQTGLLTAQDLTNNTQILDTSLLQEYPLYT